MSHLPVASHGANPRGSLRWLTSGSKCRRVVGKTVPFDGSYEALSDFSAGASFVLALSELDHIGRILWFV
jgi:hypothetical protein